ncbi:hypothetical protein LI328DRAFT_161441 [Trichoderma asperelloides]|nr:hypothetical protein LI328DRAFT_161441 [Trichoderma asperelloides]
MANFPSEQPCRQSLFLYKCLSIYSCFLVMTMRISQFVKIALLETRYRVVDSNPDPV